jgi:hypothetical protein
MEMGKVMSFSPVGDTLDTLHEMPTRASEVWKMEERRAARRTEEMDFILVVRLGWSRENFDRTDIVSYLLRYLLFFIVLRGFDRSIKQKRRGVSVQIVICKPNRGCNRVT